MLTCKNLTYEISKKKLIESISLSFKNQGLYGIVGPNGSGKSTLLKCLSGIWTPTNGRILYNNEELLKKDRHEISRLISLVPQNPHIYFDFKVEDVVSMGRYLHKTKNPELIEWALKIVDISHLRDRKITQVSSGERQRVYIARALVTECPILLLDEPTTSLDIRHHLEIWELLRHLSSEGKLVIASNHDLRITESYCDEIIVLNEGRCIDQGDAKQLLTEELLQAVFGIRSLSLEFSPLSHRDH